MKKIAILLVLILILGTIIVSGCASNKNNTIQNESHIFGKGSNESQNPPRTDMQGVLGNNNDYIHKVSAVSGVSNSIPG